MSHAPASGRRTRDLRPRSSEPLDDVDHVLPPVATPSGELEDLAHLLGDCARLRGTRDRNATTAAEFEQALFAQHPQGTEHRVLVNAGHGGEVLRGGKTVARPGLAGSDRSPDLRRDLFMQLKRFVSVDLDIYHGAMENSSILELDQHEVEVGRDEQELEAIVREARRRARRRRLRLAAAGLGALVALGAASLLIISEGSGRGGGTAGDPTAAASTAPVEYTRIKHLALMTTGGAEIGPYSLRLPIVTDVWVREDGSGRVAKRYLPGTWPGPRDRRRAEDAADRRSLAQVRGRRLPKPIDEELPATALDEEVGAPGYPAPSALPAAPGPLRQVLLASHAHASSREALFELVTGVVLRPNVDPAVKLAAFELARGLPRVEVDPAASDPRGRPAVALSFSPSRQPPMTNTLYFDTETKQAIAYEERFDRPTKTLNSRLLSSTVLSRTKIVQKIPPPAP